MVVFAVGCKNLVSPVWERGNKIRKAGGTKARIERMKGKGRRRDEAKEVRKQRKQ